MTKILIAGLAAAILCATGCKSKEVTAEASVSPPSAAVAKPETTHAGELDAVELDPSMMANIAVEQVRSQSVRGLLTATGKVQFNEDRTARVLAPLPGQVQDLSLRVGDSVERDRPLFSIKSREVASLVTDLLESKRDADLAEKTYNMTKDLFEHQAASRISMQQAEGDLAKAKVHVSRAEESLHVLGLDPVETEKTGGLRTLVPVLAPLTGVVIERPVTPGQFVQADSTPLITIADLSSVWVLVDVYERDLHLVRPGQKVQVIATAYPDRRFTATIERVSDKVDPDSRTLKVRLLVPNQELLLKPEMFITASLELNEGSSALLIPAKALFTEGDKSFLFVQAGERRFERRQILAVPEGEGRLRVTNGLQPNDRIVTDGALLLRLRQKQQQD